MAILCSSMHTHIYSNAQDLCEQERGKRNKGKQRKTQRKRYFFVIAAAAAVSPFFSFSFQLLSFRLCGVFKDKRRFSAQK